MPCSCRQRGCRVQRDRRSRTLRRLLEDGFEGGARRQGESWGPGTWPRQAAKGGKGTHLRVMMVPDQEDLVVLYGAESGVQAGRLPRTEEGTAVWEGHHSSRSGCTGRQIHFSVWSTGKMSGLERPIWEPREWRWYQKLQEKVSRPREQLCPWGKGRAPRLPSRGASRGRGGRQGRQRSERKAREAWEGVVGKEGECGLLLRGRGG